LELSHATGKGERKEEGISSRSGAEQEKKPERQPVAMVYAGFGTASFPGGRGEKAGEAS
jgi:hypothetical protein